MSCARSPRIPGEVPSRRFVPQSTCTRRRRHRIRMERDTSSKRANEIKATFAGFRLGGAEQIRTVRAWAETIVRGGNWRFSDPEGVVQETLLKLLRLAAAGRVRDPESFQKFVYTVAKNTCVTVYHRERSRARHEEPAGEFDEPPAPDATTNRLERAERLTMLREILQRLPEACRQLWDSIYRERRTPDEVASALGITPVNVRVRVHRCTEKARAILRELSLSPTVAP